MGVEIYAKIMVTLSDSQGRHSETICGDFYNKEMAAALEV